MVPTASTRRLLQQGREKLVEFASSMSKEQVKETLLKSFPKLRLEKPFFNCNCSKQLVEITINDCFPTGEEVVGIFKHGVHVYGGIRVRS